MGEYFYEGILSSLLSPTDTLLNENHHLENPMLTFSNQLYCRDGNLELLIAQLKESGHDKLLFEETLANILSYLLMQHRSVIKTVQELPSVKQCTRIDLYKRLVAVTDYLNSTDDYNIDLSELASKANLSKYHFLRLFKIAFRLSPHQYIQQLRLAKAAELLKKKTHSVKEISALLGFENSNSFSRLFYQRTGKYPADFQRRIN